MRLSDQILRVAPDSLPGGEHRHSVETARRFQSAASPFPVLADDIVFDQVHPYLAAVTTEEGHKRWHEALRRIAALHPLVVIASHKKAFDSPSTPDVVDAMDRYLTDFDAVRKTAKDTGDFNIAMRQKYPDWSGDRLLRPSAAVAYGLLTPRY